MSAERFNSAPDQSDNGGQQSATPESTDATWPDFTPRTNTADPDKKTEDVPIEYPDDPYLPVYWGE